MILGPFLFDLQSIMKINDLIRHFSAQTTLPVDVNGLLPVLRNNGTEDDIEFIGVDFDPEILQGQIKIFYSHAVPYGEPTRCANIYYHRGHSLDWQRFICCKELLHLLDPNGAQSRTQEEINDLAERIGLPEYMQDATEDGFATNVDRLAEFRAAAILLPYAARELLKQPLAEHKITLGDIAEMADIPRKYAAHVMSAKWDYVHELFLR